MTRAEVLAVAAAHPGAEDVGRLARHALALMDRVEGRAVDVSEAIRSGMARAQRQGIHVGRPPREDIDVERIGALWSEGYSAKAIALETGYARSTVARRLRAMGMEGE